MGCHCRVGYSGCHYGPWITRAGRGAVTTELGFLLSLLEAGAYIARVGRRLSLPGRGVVETIITGVGWGLSLKGFSAGFYC